MRFSFWPTPSLPYTDVLDLAQHVQAGGWHGIWYADHFMPNAPDTSTPWPEAWTTLSALGAQVPNLRLGTLVSGNTYRHPAVLAKMAATLDHITEGRVVLGLGSGWQENEHEQYGIEFFTVNERLKRLREACQVIKALFNESQANFEGSFYQLKNASLEPKPVQANLPLLIGGGGEKVTLRIVAELADEWNVWGDPEILAHKSAILNQHCADLGRNPDDIHRTAVALLFMSEDEQVVAKMKESASPMPMPRIVGTPAELKDTIAAYAEAGVGELIVPDFTLGKHEQKKAALDLFMEKVAN